MTPEVKALLAKARRRLEAAVRDLTAGDAEDAISRAYYAAFHAATAALLAEGETPKSHTGVHDQFYRILVATDRLPRELSRTLARAYTLRQKSDYSLDPGLTMEQAAALVDDVRQLISQVEAFLS